MAQLQPTTDPTEKMSQVELNKQDIKNIMDELNRGLDPTSMARRSVLASQLRVISYQPSPLKLHSGSTLAAGAYAELVINFQNNGLTANDVGQTYLPVFYVDLFIDPSDTSSTDNMYANAVGDIFPDGANMTSGKVSVNFTWYLRNSTPGTDEDLVSYVLAIKNSDSAAHAYWASVQLLLPADGNLNEGDVASLLT